MTTPVLAAHHLGVAVSNLDSATSFYCNSLGLQLLSGPFDDPIQKVRVSFLGHPADQVVIELIMPLNESSPVNGFLSKGIGAYHICYQVPNLEATLATVRGQGCLLLGQPVPAVAFEGRRIAWCCTPTKHLIEFVEAAKAE